MKKKNVRLSFLAIDPFIETNIVRPVEGEVRGKDFITWGEKNDYPNYLDSLYDNVSTLKTIIDGLTDYVCGETIVCKNPMFNEKVNNTGLDIYELVHRLAHDFARYGGFALNVVRNKAKGIAGLYYLDFANCRTNKDRTIVYYADDWAKSYGRVKCTDYPNFTYEPEAASSIYYFTTTHKTVYPAPMYAAAVIPCEIEKKINEFGINLLSNGLNSNFIINFNNGVPNDEQKEEIEADIYEKFTGTENTGRPIIAWNDDKEHAASIDKIDDTGWADKYQNLQKTAREQIYNAFRCSPILFGIDMHNTGFSDQEYASVYTLFNRTVVKPIQDKIKLVFDKIFDETDFLTIEPFRISFDKEEKN